MRALLAVSLLLIAPAAAQAQGFLLRVVQENTITTIPNGAVLNLNAPGVGQSATLRIQGTYAGQTTIVFQPQTVSPNGDFTVRFEGPGGGALFGLQPGQTFAIVVTYRASTRERSAITIDVPFTEAQPPATPPNPPPPPVPGLISVGIVGTAPEFILSYALPSDGNFVVVGNGAELRFPDTLVNGLTTASMFLVNRGTGVGVIDSIATAGSAFQLLAVPLLPSFVPSGEALQFQLRFRPRDTGEQTGTLQVQPKGGAAYEARLAGTGVASLVTYELILDDADPVAFVPNTVVNLPETTVGRSTTALVRFRNTSTVDATIDSIGITGAGYALTDLPFLPARLAPGQAQFFTVVVTPTQPGRFNGRLRVGGDLFDLRTTALGSRLEVTGPNGAPLSAQETVVFPAAIVGDSSTLSISVRNSGSTPASVTSIGIDGSQRNAFAVEGLGSLPFTLGPGESRELILRFRPLVTGFSGAALRVDAQLFTLSGLGLDPQPLPSYTIQAPTTVQPLEQPVVRLGLASSYPIPISGTLLLTIESDALTTDPAVQFSSGGRSVAFTIPAGSTQAVFGSGSTQIRLQTGSVAGTIVLTPQFLTQGGFDLTPSPATQARLTLAPSAPRVLGVQLVPVNNGYNVVVTGFTTTRSLTKIDLTLTPSPGVDISGTAFSLDLSGASASWFFGATSTLSGGQFTLIVPLTLSSSQSLPPNALKAVSVTLSNERGASSPVSSQL